ncbi:MAG: hypothetical protein HOW73_34910 [Polyangiaceae bacterium]|nr:hypothetical protein [Polyangiaceae bacterium]
MVDAAVSRICIRGRANLFCGGSFDRDVSVEVQCPIRRIQLLAAKRSEVEARSAFDSYIGTRPFAYLDPHRSAILELRLSEIM